MHGSPCQDFSLAGKQAGGDNGSGTRSSLMYETIRIVQKLKPKYVIWENVKNLLGKKHKHNFDNYIHKMEELGYVSYYQVLNAKDYGIPQNRERVFTISILKDVFVYDLPDNYKFQFPQKQELKLKLKDMLDDVVDKKYYLSDSMINYISASNEKWTGNNGKSIINKSIASAINTGEGSRRCDASNYISNEVEENYDLKTKDKSSVKHNLHIRKLTPKETWRLMGFDNEDYEKASKVNSDTQLYKQAGNSIVVNVIAAILKNLLQ